MHHFVESNFSKFFSSLCIESLSMIDNSKRLKIFSEVYNEHKRLLLNYLRKMVNDQELIEDTLQYTFMKFYENIDSIHNFDSVKFWLIKTARNEVYSHWRNKHNTVVSIDEDENSIASFQDIQKDLEQREFLEMMNHELEKINPEQREIFVLREYTGLSYKEIASLTGIDTELVKSRLFKIRQRLIKKFLKYV